MIIVNIVMCMKKRWREEGTPRMSSVTSTFDAELMPTNVHVTHSQMTNHRIGSVNSTFNEDQMPTNVQVTEMQMRNRIGSGNSTSELIPTNVQENKLNQRSISSTIEE